MIDQYETVDLGCGTNKQPDALGVDIVNTDKTDIVQDLNNHPWDLPDNSFSNVICEDILEHVDDPLRFLEEVHRIAKSNAEVYIRTPHFTNHNAWVDPTHRRPFSAFTFRDYITSEGDYAYYTDAKYEMIDLRIGFISSKKMPWNLIGRYIANNFTDWYEKTVLRSIFPAQSMEIELRVKK
jgi:ubiquinone/menaquinone biosynthesis C-methylase UbiE